MEPAASHCSAAARARAQGQPRPRAAAAARGASGDAGTQAGACACRWLLPPVPCCPRCCTPSPCCSSRSVSLPASTHTPQVRNWEDASCAKPSECRPRLVGVVDSEGVSISGVRMAGERVRWSAEGWGQSLSVVLCRARLPPASSLALPSPPSLVPCRPHLLGAARAALHPRAHLRCVDQRRLGHPQQ